MDIPLEHTFIAYHGTTAENAASIRANGFRPDSWFAFKREDAEWVGGPAVLAVRFDRRLLGADVGWQFHALAFIPASQIVEEA